MNQNNLDELVCYWWSMAQESLASARREFEAEAYIFSVNRIYYAVFYGATAVFLRRQKTFKKHTGVRAAFHRELIKSGLIEAQWGRVYDQLFEDRQEGDYIAMMAFDRDYVQEKLEQCDLLLSALQPLVHSTE